MSENELAGEPKNSFVNSLIRYNNQLEFLLYVQRAGVLICVHALKGFVNMLDLESHERLKEVDQEIDTYLNNLGLITGRTKLYDIHKKIVQYLHNTYWRECRFAKPKFGKTDLGVPET